MTNRKALAAGAFLLSAGAVALVGTMNAAVGDAIVQALRLWPLAIIALGVGLLLRRTRLGLAGTLVAAIVPGLLLGGIVVAAPDTTTFCATPSSAPTVTDQGTFTGTAGVDLFLACGDVTVTTAPGTGWRVDTRALADGKATVTSTADRLSVHSYRDGEGYRWDHEGDAWSVTLPTDTTLDVDARVAAGRGRFDLSGAHLGRLAVEADAGDVRVDMTSATVESIVAQVRAAKATILLPADDLTGSVNVAAGSARVCVPAGLAIRVTGDAVLGDIHTEGLVRVGDAWQTPGYPTAAHRADLDVTARAGSVTIDTFGGCK